MFNYVVNFLASTGQAANQAANAITNAIANFMTTPPANVCPIQPGVFEQMCGDINAPLLDKAAEIAGKAAEIAGDSNTLQNVAIGAGVVGGAIEGARRGVNWYRGKNKPVSIPNALELALSAEQFAAIRGSSIHAGLNKIASDKANAQAMIYISCIPPQTLRDFSKVGGAQNEVDIWARVKNAEDVKKYFATVFPTVAINWAEPQKTLGQSLKDEAKEAAKAKAKAN